MAPIRNILKGNFPPKKNVLLSDIEESFKTNKKKKKKDLIDDDEINDKEVITVIIMI